MAKWGRMSSSLWQRLNRTQCVPVQCCSLLNGMRAVLLHPRPLPTPPPA